MNYPTHHREQYVDIQSADYRGHIRTKVLSQILSDAAGEHTKKLGVDVDSLAKDGITWMLHSIHIRILRMPHTGEQMCIDTFPAGFDRLFALRCYDMKSESGEELVKASSRWMQIDINRRRPVRPTPLVVELNSNLSMPADMPDGSLSNEQMPDGMEQTRHFVATFDNIDFNGHVTQASYMMWATDSLTFDFHKEHSLEEVEMIYMHEIMPEEEIAGHISITEEDGHVTVHHKLTSADGQTTHCIARTQWRKCN